MLAYYYIVIYNVFYKVIKLITLNINLKTKNMNKLFSKENFLELVNELFLENHQYISTSSIFSKKNERNKILSKLCNCTSNELCDEILAKNNIDITKLDEIDEKLHFEMERKVKEYIKIKILDFARHAKILGFKLNFDIIENIEEFEVKIYNSIINKS